MPCLPLQTHLLAFNLSTILDQASILCQAWFQALHISLFYSLALLNHRQPLRRLGFLRFLALFTFFFSCREYSFSLLRHDKCLWFRMQLRHRILWEGLPDFILPSSVPLPRILPWTHYCHITYHPALYLLTLLLSFSCLQLLAPESRDCVCYF